MVWGLGVSALVATVVGLFMSQRIVAPIRNMQRAGQRIAAGQYKERLDRKPPVRSRAGRKPLMKWRKRSSRPRRAAWNSWQT
jgi:nitrogen fixation/metabolism regulation signal transduction histidine kinase